MTVKQLSVFLENKPNRLSTFAMLLREHDIDMRALSIAEVEDYGILRLIVDDVDKASKVLKEADYVFKITPVLAVPLKDESGALADALVVLGKNGINIEYLYAFVGRPRNKAWVIFRVADEECEKAIATLAAAGHTPVGQDALRFEA